jgi:hypothetical protein
MWLRVVAIALLAGPFIMAHLLKPQVLALFQEAASCATSGVLFTAL